MTVYLLHIDQPLDRGVSARGTLLKAGHYLGSTDDLQNRLDEHAKTTWVPFEAESTSEGKRRLGEKHGNGAVFMGAVNFKGIPWQVVRLWNGGVEVEKKLKAFHCAPKLCPICNANAFRRMNLESAQ